MQAIILCAGKSSRLGEIIKDTPKSLIDISGKCSLGRQIENLSYSGIKNIILVTGYKEEMIQSYIENIKPEFKDVKFEIIYNADWETTNNAKSLALGLEIAKYNDIIVLNADVVCYKDLIKEFVQHPTSSAMAIVRKKELNEEDMKVKVNGFNVIEVAKTININEGYGEFTGIFKLEKQYVSFLRECLDIEISFNPNCWFESALNILCGKGLMSLVDLSNYPYIEVDFPEDLETARDRFHYDYPVWEQGRRQESIKQGKRDIDNCIELMADFAYTLHKYQIRYWLNWGLLLGCVREGQPLKYDTDLDICIDKSNEEILWEKVVPEMKKLRCFVPDRKLHCDNDCFIMRDGEAIECNTVDLINGKYIYSPERCKLSCPDYYLNKLEWIKIRNNYFTIPSYVDKYLTGWYGNWRTPSNTKPKSFQ